MDESTEEASTEVVSSKPKVPPPQITEDKETVSEPLYEEDIIDGFSICSFKDYNDLEKMAKWSELHNGKFPDPYARLKLEEEVAKREREEREAKEAALAAEKKPT